MLLGWMPSSRRQAALRMSLGLSVNVRSLDIVTGHYPAGDTGPDPSAARCFGGNHLHR